MTNFFEQADSPAAPTSPDSTPESPTTSQTNNFFAQAGEPEGPQPGLAEDLVTHTRSAFVSSFGADAKALGLITGNEWLEEKGDYLFKVSDEISQNLSRDAVEGQQKSFVEDADVGRSRINMRGELVNEYTAGEGWADIDTWNSLIGSAIGSLGAVVAGGGITKVGAQFAGRSIGKAVGRQAARKKAVEEALKEGGEEAAKSVLKKQAAREATKDSVIGTLAYGVNEGLMVGGSAAKDVEDHIMAMPGETLSQAPLFQEVYWGLRDELKMSHDQAFEEARKTTAKSLGTTAVYKAGIPSVLLGAVAGRYINKALTGKLEGSRAMRAAKGFGTEATTEGGQGAVEHLAKGYTIQEADAEHDPHAGLANAAVSEALGGGIAGAGLGAATPGGVESEVKSRKQQNKADAADIEAEIQKLEEAAEYEQSLEAARQQIMPNFDMQMPLDGGTKVEAGSKPENSVDYNPYAQDMQPLDLPAKKAEADNGIDFEAPAIEKPEAAGLSLQPKEQQGEGIDYDPPSRTEILAGKVQDEIDRGEREADAESLTEQANFFDQNDKVDSLPEAEAADAAEKQGVSRRFGNPAYRGAVESLASDLVKGGDVSYVRGENDQITGRTPSVNPKWFQSNDDMASVDYVKSTVEKALKGEKLGPRQQRVVEALMDAYESENQFDQEQEGEYGAFDPADDRNWYDEQGRFKFDPADGHGARTYAMLEEEALDAGVSRETLTDLVNQKLPLKDHAEALYAEIKRANPRGNQSRASEVPGREGAEARREEQARDGQAAPDTQRSETEGLSDTGDTAAVTPQEASNNAASSDAVTPQEGEGDTVAVAPQKADAKKEIGKLRDFLIRQSDAGRLGASDVEEAVDIATIMASDHEIDDELWAAINKVAQRNPAGLSAKSDGRSLELDVSEKDAAAIRERILKAAQSPHAVDSRGYSEAKGEQEQSQQADTPETVTKANGDGFVSEKAVKAALKGKGLNADEYRITKQQDGTYVANKFRERKVSKEETEARQAAVDYINWQRSKGAESVLQLEPGVYQGRTFLPGDKAGTNHKISKNGILVDNRFKFPLSKLWQEAVAHRQSEIEAGANEADTNPTEAQKEAGNYKKGRITFHGIQIGIENPAGSMRSGTSPDGKKWENKLLHHYGDVTGVIGADGDQLDVFVNSGANAEESRTVFVIDQTDADGQFDEHKVMLGFRTESAAIKGYKSNYDAGWKVGPVTEMTLEEFQEWIDDGDTTQPLSGQVKKGWPLNLGIENDSDKELLKYFTPFEKEISDGLLYEQLRSEARKGSDELEAAIKYFGKRDPEKTKSYSTLPLLRDWIKAQGENNHLSNYWSKDFKILVDDAVARTKAEGYTPEQVSRHESEVYNPKVNGYFRHDTVTFEAIIADLKSPFADGRGEAAPEKNSELPPKSTAPEHAAIGVDERELSQIVSEFNKAMEAQRDAGVHHQFDHPEKSEITRLGQKSKVYHKDHGWMTPAEAKKVIAEWKANAEKQGENPSTNAHRIVLSLFDLTGSWSKPWEDAGYQVFRFDIQDDVEVGDVNNFSSEFFSDWFGDFEGQDIYAILAACPCTDFASSGARHFAAKDKDGRTVASVNLVHQTLRTIEYFKPSIWALENPVGRIEKLGGLPPWRLSFDPNDLGDNYTKKTLIWGNFNSDLPIAPVEPTEGSKMHRLYGGKSLATKNARSATPEGFAYGFFAANNAVDHPILEAAGKYDRLDRDLLQQALDAGLSMTDIDHAVEDAYYMDLDDAAAEAALREAIEEHAEGGKPDERRDTEQHEIYSRRTEDMSETELREYVEQLRSEILTDERTGLGSNRAWIQRKPKKFVASIDLDSLKWVNDNMGHGAGDEMIALVGEALRQGGIGSDSYHVSGDEFYAQADDFATLTKALNRARKWLGEQSVSGNGIDFKGPAFSYGIARDLHEAENNLQKDKSKREQAGTRAGRGQRPSGAVDSGKQSGRDATESGSAQTAEDGQAGEVAYTNRFDTPVDLIQFRQKNLPKEAGPYGHDGEDGALYITQQRYNPEIGEFADVKLTDAELTDLVNNKGEFAAREAKRREKAAEAAKEKQAREDERNAARIKKTRNEAEVRRPNGQPFTNKKQARAYLDKWKLGATHYIDEINWRPHPHENFRKRYVLKKFPDAPLGKVDVRYETYRDGKGGYFDMASISGDLGGFENDWHALATALQIRDRKPPSKEMAESSYDGPIDRSGDAYTGRVRSSDADGFMETVALLQMDTDARIREMYDETPAITWEKRSPKSWRSSDGQIIADHSFTSGGDRIKSFMVYANEQDYHDGRNYASGQTLTEAKANAKEAPLLNSYSEQELRNREEETKTREQLAEARKRSEEAKAKADKERDSFALTGSDRAADVAAAQGQNSLFDASGKASASKPEESGRRAKPGGEYGLNGEWYTGGQFMPSSAFTVKGEHKSHGGKAGATKKALVEPGKLEEMPKDAMPIFQRIALFTDIGVDGNLTVKTSLPEVAFDSHFDNGRAEVESMAELYNNGARFMVPEGEKVNTQISEKSQGTKTEQKPAASKVLEDTGEKLGGARKDMQITRTSIEDGDFESESFAKVWPKNAFQDVGNKFIEAFAYAARASVPNKPRVSYKVKRWVEKATALRDSMLSAVRLFETGDLNEAEFLKRMHKYVSLDDLATQIQVLNAIDKKHWKRIDSARVSHGVYSYRKGPDGKSEATPKKSALFLKLDGRSVGVYGPEGVQTEIEDLLKRPEFIEAIEGTENQDVSSFKDRQKFEIRGRKGYYAINRKGDKEYRPLKSFEGENALVEARQYLNNNIADLFQAWEDVKARDNVGKADVRALSMSERKGKDYRDGRDVAPEEFMEVFGFRGVEFGNWVKQGKAGRDRQGFVNQAYDALLDLAKLLNIPPETVALNGDIEGMKGLGLAFGSRGSGKAAAHYEAGSHVINLTKTNGAGTLAHEWFHALDSYFAGHREDPGSMGQKEDVFITYRPEPYYRDKVSGTTLPATDFEAMAKGERGRRGQKFIMSRFNRDNWIRVDGVRPEVQLAFADLVKVLDESPMKGRASLIDKGKADGYWSRIIERAARSFENYIVARMEEEGIQNDFLASFNKIDSFKRNPERYPYLLPEEMAPVKEAFDKLFEAMQSKQTPRGTVLYSLNDSVSYRIGGNPAAGIPAKAARKAVDRLQKRMELDAEVVDSWVDLPDHLMRSVLADGVENKVRGVYDETSGRVYIVAGNLQSEQDAVKVYLHEVLGHHGLRAAVGKKLDVVLTQLYKDMPAAERTRLEAKYRRQLKGKPAAEAKRIVADEYVAHLAERDPSNNLLRRVVSMVRNWLRDTFKAFEGMHWTESDVIELLQSGRREMAKGSKSGKPGGARYEQAQRPVVADSDLLAGWTLLAQDDAVFQLPTSDAKTIEGVFDQVSKLKVEEAPELAMQADGEPENGWRVNTDRGEVAAIYEKGDSVWIDVSDLKQGSDGREIYNAVANYAYNTGKTFIGDPAGLSDVASSRRLEQMLSSALKFGTTDHLWPHEKQELGFAGVPGIKWKDGDFTHNVEQMINASYRATLSQFPEIANLVYNPASGEFENKETGRVWRDREFQQLAALGRKRLAEADREFFNGAGRGPAPDPVTAGRTTLERAVITHSLSSRQSREGRLRLLASLSERNPRFKGILYSLADEDTEVALDKLGLGREQRRGLRAAINKLKLINFREAWTGLKERAYEGMFDGLVGIKRAEDAEGVGIGAGDYESSGYVGARLASGIADTMHAILHYGAPKWGDGVIEHKEGTEGLLEVLGELGPDLREWLGWMGGKRAQELKAQGRENNLSNDDIDALLALRTPENQAKFDRAQKKYAKLNKAMLDLAEGAGLIDPDSRKKWESEWYIPFYRQDIDGDGLLAPRTKRGLSHQSAGIKALRGSEVATNDLLQNLLTNWMKLADASMKNMALLKTVDNLKDTDYFTNESLKYTQAIIPKAEVVKKIKADRAYLEMVGEMMGLFDAGQLEILHELNKLDTQGFEKLWAITAPRDKDVIRVQRGGKNEYYKVNDPALLRGLVHLNNEGIQNLLMKSARGLKRLLTTGVTAAPDFMMRNMFRDAFHAWAINKDKDADGNRQFKFGRSSLEGLKRAFQEDADYRELMFANASFQGGYIHGTDPDAAAQAIRRALRKKGLTPAEVNDHMETLVDKGINLGEKGFAKVMRGWEAYRGWGDKLENTNRLATFKAAKRAGKSLAQAVFESKDLMDYSLRGNWTVMNVFTDIVPFLNARLQGLSKLVRAAELKGEPLKPWTWRTDPMVGKAVAQMVFWSAALALWNDDDEDYNALPDWEKDAYWHFFIEGQHFRMPKPFEIGIIGGTIPERIMHAWILENQPDDKVLWSLEHNLLNTLSFNPTPQALVPVAELWANRSFFFDTPIESMSDRRLLPRDRYNAFTSSTAVELGQLTGMSPKQLQHVWEGYTGTMGAYALWGMDALVNLAQKKPNRGEVLPTDIPVLKSFWRGDKPAHSTQYMTDLYDRLKESSQLMASFKEMQDPTARREFLQEYGDKMGTQRMLSSASRTLNQLRKQRDRILEMDIPRREKQRQLDDIQRRINEVAKQASAQSEFAF